MPGDSYELLFEVKSSGEAALDAIESKIRGVDNAGKSASGTVDGIGGSAGRAAGPVSQLADQLRAAVAAINANTSSVKILAGSLDGVSVSSRSAASGIDGVSSASRRMVTETMAATGALRALDGSLNIRSAGRFLTDVLGLGPALQAIFPLISGIAIAGVFAKMAEETYRVGSNILFMRDAMKEVGEAAKGLASDTESAYAKTQKAIIETLRLQGKHIEAAKMEQAGLASQVIKPPQIDKDKLGGTGFTGYLGAGLNTPNNQRGWNALLDNYSELIPAGLDERIKNVRTEMERLQADVKLIDKNSFHGINDPFVIHARSQDQTEITAYKNLIPFLDQQKNLYGSEQGKSSAEVGKAEDDEAKRRAEELKRARAEVTAAEKQASTILRDAQTYELSGLEKIIVKRRELLEVYGKTKKAIDDINAAMNLEQGREISKIQKDNRAALSGYLSGDGVSDIGKTNDKDFAKQLKETIANEEKEIRELQAAADRYDKADSNAVKREADKALRISDLSAGSGSGAQGIANNNAYQIRLDLAKQLFDIEARRIDRLDDEGEREKALAQARLDYEDELDKARTDHEIKFLELQKKDLDEVHNLAASFYDAIRRGGTGLQQFFSSQGQNIGRTLFSNAATEGYKAIGAPTLGGLIPGQTGPDGQLTTIGRILQGTPFGTNAKDSAQKTNTSALQRLTSSVDRLAARISGRAVGSDSGDATGSGEGSCPETWGLPNAGMPGDFGGEVADANKLVNALGNTSVPGMVGVSFSDLGTMTQAALVAPMIAAGGAGAVAAMPTGSGEAGVETWGLPTAGSPNNSSGEVSSATSLLKALSGGGSDFTGALTRFAQPGQGPGAIMDAITGDSGDSGAQRVGVLVGAGTAAATGIMGVIQGIDQGGARGTLSAVGAGAGTIAAFDPDPVTKSILASVAAGSALIKGLLGNPQQERSLYEQRALRADQYFAPPTITRTTDSYGNDAGYNFMGQAHSLPYQTFSEVMPYDKNYTMPFGSGVPNVWGEVPGQIIQPWTDPQNYDKDFSTPNGTNGGNAPAQPIQYITINAIDQQGVAQFFQKNSAFAASAVSKEIKNGHPVGMAVQQAVFGT